MLQVCDDIIEPDLSMSMHLWPKPRNAQYSQPPPPPQPSLRNYVSESAKDNRGSGVIAILKKRMTATLEEKQGIQNDSQSSSQVNRVLMQPNERHFRPLGHALGDASRI